MEKSKILFSLLPICIFLSACQGQKPFGAEQLTLKQSILLPGVKGRIDHMDVNLKEQVVYMSALGNNSLEIVDIKNGKLLHSIKGLDEPQGVGFVSQTNEIMVANGGNGDCKFYNEETLQNTATINPGSDADDVRYDSIDKKIYVGYGSGGIAVIDAIKHQQAADVKLSAHPEGFQIDKELKKLFVNVPDAGQIEVIDLESLTVVSKWKTEYSANFPMAIDKSNHIIFIGYRHPAKLVAINESTGKTIATADLTGDTDDLYYNSRTKKIYASGGSGAIDIYLFENLSIKHVANILTRDGARTSLLIPSMKIFVLAERAGGGRVAQLQIFNINE
jgi:DNA-binding beta-propeller fold protein YncE